MKNRVATAFRVSLVLDRVKDEEMRTKIQTDINHAERYGVIYLASYLPQIKAIEDLGFCFKKKKYKNIETVYCVFPFFEYLAKGEGVTLLIPARTDTKAFKLLFEYGSKITFISGRLKFNEANSAPFPSMIVRLCGGGDLMH